MGRRLARELALKVLYRYEEGDTDLENAMRSVLGMKEYQKNDIAVTSESSTWSVENFEKIDQGRKEYQKNDKDFTEALVRKTMENLEEIDRKIVAVLENWEYDRISLVDKIILRMGACELIYFSDIPSQISINEAIEIGKKYGGSDSGRFINGVLDAVRKKHESSDN